MSRKGSNGKSIGRQGKLVGKAAAPNEMKNGRRNPSEMEKVMAWVDQEADAAALVADRFSTGLTDSTPSQWKNGDQPVPRHRLLRFLGRGGFGEVWEAVTDNDMHVALKLISLEKAAGLTERRALEIIKNLSHPFLLPLRDFWEHRGWLVIATLLAEQTLADRYKYFRDRGCQGIPQAELANYISQIDDVLGYLRANGIQHCDVKPSNILLRNGYAFLGDFGLARQLKGGVPPTINIATMKYAPPEFLQQRVTRFSDLYSLAITYCEMRTGLIPYTNGCYRTASAEADLSMFDASERQTCWRLRNALDRRLSLRRVGVNFVLPFLSGKPRCEDLEVKVLAVLNFIVNNYLLEESLYDAKDDNDPALNISKQDVTTIFVEHLNTCNVFQSEEIHLEGMLEDVATPDLERVYRWLQTDFALTPLHLKIANALGLDTPAPHKRCCRFIRKVLRHRKSQ
jgi:serine/threonine protein kinase